MTPVGFEPTFEAYDATGLSFDLRGHVTNSKEVLFVLYPSEDDSTKQ